MTAIRVGEIEVFPPILLAPMEDITNAAFRQIVKRIAKPGLMFTEFVSAMAIHHGPKATLAKMKVRKDERPLAIQIFGGDPEIMAEAARTCEALGADAVDINMGCWVPKVCKSGAGAALLKDPKTAERIVRSVVKAINIPVTVKVRAGWHYDLFAAPDLAKRFEAAGAKMLTLHARFAKQGFEGRADWRLITELRRAIRIPLIGNGDVKDPHDALRMMRETGCDGVMVGRAAISNPWALRRIVEAVSGKPLSLEPTISERIRIALEHLRSAVQLAKEDERQRDFSEVHVVKSLRGQIPLYVKGEPGAAAVRSRITQATTYREVEDILREYEQSICLNKAVA